MNITRNSEGVIVSTNEDGSEIHPFITTLAAIEAQQRIIPPLVPRLSSLGWDQVKLALNEAITSIGANRLTEALPLISSDDLPVEEPDPADAVDDKPVDNEKLTPGRKPQKPIYKAG